MNAATNTAAPLASTDQAVLDGVRSRLRDIHNHAALALAISVGHRVALFDVMAAQGPASSEVLAAAAGLDERYVREWLSALSAGGIVAFDPVTETFLLPAEYAAMLTRRGSPDNVAVSLQLIPMLASVESELVGCFRNGGGLGYEAYGRFHEIMAEMSSQTVVSALFDDVLALAPELPRRLQEGIDVVDVGCGQGRALIAMASTYPNSSFLGIDLSHAAVDAARRHRDALRLRNVRFEVMDAARMPKHLRADLVMAFDAIHDQAEPETVLRGIRDMLGEDGLFFMQEMATSSHLEENLDHPLGPFLYTLSFGHCLSVSLGRDGVGLGTCWGRERATEMLERAGFAPVRRCRLPHDPMNEFYVARPSTSTRVERGS